MATRVLFDGLSNLSGWSNNSGWLVASGFASATGDAFGRPTMRRASGLSTHLGYFEVEMYVTGSGNNWASFAPDWGTDTNAYNDDGYMYLLRGPNASPSTNNQINGLTGTGSTVPTSGWPVRLGIEITGATTSNVYVNRVLAYSSTGLTDHSANRNIALGVFNSAVGYFRNVSVWDAFPGALALSSVSSPSRTRGTSGTHTLTGIAFAGTPTVSVSGTGVTVSSVSVVSDTSLTATFAVAGSAAAGARNVTVTMDDGSTVTLTSGFTVTTLPSIASKVAEWWASDLATADGGSVSSWTDRVSSLVLAAGGTSPVMRATGGPNSQPAVEFNGTNNYMALGSQLTTSPQGVVLAVCSLTDPAAGTSVWSEADNGSSSRYLLGTTSYTGAGKQVESQWRNGGGNDIARGLTAVPAAVFVLLEWASNGTVYAHRLNGEPQAMSVVGGSNSGNWFGDASLIDNFVVGALIRNTSGSYCAMKLSYLMVADAPLSSGDRANLNSWITSTYGLSLPTEYADLVAADGAIMYLPAYGGSTTDPDRSGNGHNLTWSSAPSASDLLSIPGGVTLAGATEATITSGSWMDTIATVEAWVKFTSTNDMAIMSRRNFTEHFAVYHNNTNGLRFTYAWNSGVQAATIDSGVHVNDGTLHHVVVAWNSTTYEFIVDGISVASGSLAHIYSQAASGDTLRVASENSGSPGRLFSGRIGHVAVYPTKMSAATAATHNALGRRLPTVGNLLASDSANRSNGALGATDSAYGGTLGSLAYSGDSTITIASNRIVGTSAAAQTMAVDVGTPNVSIELTMPTAPPSGNVGIVARNSASGIGFWFGVSPLAAGGGGYWLQRHPNKADTGSVNIAGPFGTWAPGDVLRLDVFGDNFWLWRNGVLLGGPYTDSFNNTVTKHGIWWNGVASGSLDDLKIYELVGPSTSTTLISPAHGPVTGGTAVSISGSGFTGATAVTFGGVAATSFTVVDDTTVTAVTPAHTGGAVSVVVTTPAGAEAVSYTYDEPTITSLSVVDGPIAGGTSVVLTGTGFTGVTSVTFGGTAATSFTVDSDTQITAVSPAHAVGAVHVVVTAPPGAGSTSTSADLFTFYAPCTVTGVSPPSGTTLGNTTVTLTGTGFTGVTSVTFGGSAATSIIIISDTSLTVHTPAHSPGVVDVVVTNPRESSPIVSGDEYTFVTPAPTITSVSPESGHVAGGDTVTITGYTFTGATVVTFDGTSVAFTVDSDTQITATSPPHAAGIVHIDVTTPAGTSTHVLADEFRYYEPFAVTSVDPAFGPTTGGTAVTIHGTDGFTGVTSVTFDGVPATSVVVADDATVTAVSPAHTAGAVDVIVHDAYGASSSAVTADQFTYFTPPAITSVSPDHDSTLGGTTVTLTGTGFTGVTSVTFGGTATAILTQSDTSITVKAPAHAAGVVDVVVTRPGVGSGTLTAGFTYIQAGQVTHHGVFDGYYTVWTATITGVVVSAGLTLSLFVNGLPAPTSDYDIEFTTNTSGHGVPSGGSLATSGNYSTIGTLDPGEVIEYTITRFDSDPFDTSAKATMRITDNASGVHWDAHLYVATDFTHVGAMS